MSSSLLTPDVGLLFWMILSFGAVLLILAKFGFPVILKQLDKRKKYIDESILAAQEAYNKLESVKLDSERMIEQAKEEHTKIIMDAAQKRDRILDKAQEDGNQRAQHIVDVARRQIMREKEEALTGLRREIAVLSVDIAEKVLRESLENKEKQMSMINKLVDEINFS